VHDSWYLTWEVMGWVGNVDEVTYIYRYSVGGRGTEQEMGPLAA
jgi:hypothetical protein